MFRYMVSRWRIRSCLVPHQRDALKIEGYIGAQELSRQTHAGQTLIVNGRVIQSKLLSEAVQKGYGQTLMIGRFPFFVLNLEMPYANVDVNVHPQKVEVRFADPLAISDSITEAVQQSVALQQKGRKETESPFAYQEKDSSADALSEQAPQQMELEEKGQTDDRVPGFKEEDTQHIDYTKHTLWEKDASKQAASFTFRLWKRRFMSCMKMRVLCQCILLLLIRQRRQHPPLK